MCLMDCAVVYSGINLLVFACKIKIEAEMSHGTSVTL
jgi:hypothetical protein